jgi:murein DD-endopeptidase MepM/ murein hydrolase activator NlpD
MPFRFPLDDTGIFDGTIPLLEEFATYKMITRGSEHHAAEDILQPAGTPVYAIADGRVSFSGRMGGYGWLVIVDHPQADIYSLYGHLSPSRWQIEKGTVQKGELLGYLGDSDENGGSRKYPLRPHLHFGVRDGQRADYPGMGQWRWQAGWVKPCPQDLGWLQPSLVISNQDMQVGERSEPTASFLTRWWIDLLFMGIYVVGGLSMFLVSERRKKPFLLIPTGIALYAAAWLSISKGLIMSDALLVMATLFMIVGLYRLVRRRTRNSTVG